MKMTSSISQGDRVIVRYNKPAIFMHWAIFLLVVIAYVAINVRGPKGSDTREFWTGIHVWAGLFVLSLSLARVGWRLTHTPPPDEPGSALMSFLAKAAHIALYAFIIVQPLLGILIFNLEGHPVILMGSGWSFSVVGANAALAPLAKDTHELLGNIFYYVIGLHALAALWHHYILHDNTLRKML
ncbi:cytochrome b [Eoetvoesiella caeni]|uniref:Cytochrome b561 n=1 Tax=Eoetvoesiella caeni TaxID=645616 RepID=A0A366H3L9_9BURK|nr:cytochrome b [Eoetvoesiella caeni]MCI2810941.1 cytochrome b [Eoetvoesiella caeni]RBP35404.1 cytochrome b561 [Eoetvoesiella caeni]